MFTFMICPFDFLKILVYLVNPYFYFEIHIKHYFFSESFYESVKKVVIVSPLALWYFACINLYICILSYILSLFLCLNTQRAGLFIF